MTVHVAYIPDEPGATPVASPEEFIVAAEVFEIVQVTPLITGCGIIGLP